MRYHKAGLFNDVVIIRNIMNYTIKETNDTITLEYDKEIKQYTFFGKPVVLHYKRLFIKHSLLELSFRESLTDKLEERF